MQTAGFFWKELAMSDAVFLTKARAEKAVALAEPTILQMMRTVTNHEAVHIVVLGLDGHVLHEQDLGPGVKSEAERFAKCTEIARSKAKIHFRNQRPSTEVQVRRPHTLRIGDTCYGGSAEHEGIIVGVSGVQSCYDEAFAGIIASILWALCVDAQSVYMAKTDKAPHYAGVV